MGRRSRSFDFPTRSRRPSAALASWTFPTETLMPWTAAACVMIVRMKDISIANVAEPAPCLARFLPNSIRRSRLSADSFTPPSSVLSDPITAAFDRRGGFPASCMSSSRRPIKSPNVRTFRTARGLDDPLRSILRSISSAHSPPSFCAVGTSRPHTGSCGGLGRASFPMPIERRSPRVCTPAFGALCVHREVKTGTNVQFRLAWSAHVRASSH